MTQAADIPPAATDDSGTAQSQAPSLERLPPDATIILPTRNLVLFPGILLPLTIARPHSTAAVQQAMREERPIGILMQRDVSLEDPAQDNLHRVGTIADILRYVPLPDGTHQIVCE